MSTARQPGLTKATIWFSGDGEELDVSLMVDGPGKTGDKPFSGEPPTLSLDTVSYDLEGDVVAAGRGQGEREVRVYVNNRLASSSMVQTDGNWRVELRNVREGVHTLRVDEVDPQGNVQARVESPFKREILPRETLISLNVAQPLGNCTIDQGHDPAGSHVVGNSKRRLWTRSQVRTDLRGKS